MRNNFDHTADPAVNVLIRLGQEVGQLAEYCDQHECPPEAALLQMKLTPSTVTAVETVLQTEVNLGIG